jgi:hypothetical protein
MKPSAAEYNPDPVYLKELIDSTGLDPREIGVILGHDRRTIERWLAGERRFPYSIQFALECLVLDV